MTGESCGQVSSQTLENIAAVDQVAGMPILRPLIGTNKEEIITAAKELGTFPVSIQPDQDCCTLFVPKHPVIRAEAAMVAKLESTLPVDELVQQAVENTQVKNFSFADMLTAAAAG